MCVIVSVSMNIGLTLYISFGRFTVLFYNGAATKYRFIYGKRVILLSPEHGKLINFFKKTPTKKFLFHFPLLFKFQTFTLHPIYWGYFLQKNGNAPSKCFYVKTK